jgi:acetyltransferase-like isoleucine patch superfamily enzyme
MNRIKDHLIQNLKSLSYSKKFSSVERGLYIVGKPLIHGEGKIFAGKNLYLRSLAQRIEIFADKAAVIDIGDNVTINQGVTIASKKMITIGNSTVIGDQTTIYDTDWHGIDGNEIKTSPVVIGKHVWICAKSIILKGVEVGDNSIIGAGSVVTHEVKPNTIMAGNPAKCIGFTESGYSS